MEVVVIETRPLGDRSYLIHDGEVALVIDPQRDTDRVEAAAAEANVRITHVAETHLHNDYLTGGLILASAHGAVYLVNGADAVHFEHTPMADGGTVRVGRLTVKAVATPGHTHHHLSYVVTDGQDQAVFSGGSLLYGSVGRTDLVTPDDTEKLTHAQYTSVRRLTAEARPDAALYPTHGFGSFCSSGPASGAESSTIAEQQQTNHALTDPDEDHFVQELISNLTAYPSYYAHMAPANRKGPGPAGTSPWSARKTTSPRPSATCPGSASTPPTPRSERNRRHSRPEPPSCIIRAWTGPGCRTAAAGTCCWMCGAQTSTTTDTNGGR